MEEESIGMIMKGSFVHYGYVDVYDDKIFTEARRNEWHNYIVKCYDLVYKALKDQLDPVSPIRFTVNKALLEEVLIDAVIGMRKIIDSHNNEVENPNSFKVAAYLSYWWLRHKPATFHYPKDCDINGVKVKLIDGETEEQYNFRCKKYIWQLKHINELVAVEMVINYIFNIDKRVCDKIQCLCVNKKNKGNFCFSSFDQMQEAMYKKLIYYFSYRTISPKIIENILEAYTIHPVWELTGAHWAGDKSKKVSE